MINQETKTRIQKYFDEACKELHIDSSLYTLRFCIDDGRFPSAFNSAEWGGNTLYINEEWVELCLRSDCEFDLRYILSHEARHLYQHQVIADFKQRGKSSELPAVINQWEYEFLHYIRNEGDEDSMDKNTNQQVEIDANAFPIVCLSKMVWGQESNLVKKKSWKRLSRHWRKRCGILKLLDAYVCFKISR